MNKTREIAVLLTCHNRREKSLASLKSLYGVQIPKRYSFDVYLVDDGSIDGTADAVRKIFPQVHITQGSGDLFWNQGMRLAWKVAAQTKDYDFYLWLNDDTELLAEGLVELLLCYEEGAKQNQSPVIISGACTASYEINEFSYGGQTDDGPIIPNGELQLCKYINGNVVLVPRDIYDNLGRLSGDYTHGMGDFDYGLRAIQAGYACFTTTRYIAVCPRNESIPAWCNPNTPLLKRWHLMNSPKGLNLKEYNTFRKKFWGWEWTIYALKVYMKVLFPTLYFKILDK